MNRLFLMAILMLTLIARAHAGTVVLPKTGATTYGGYLANEVGLSYNQTYTLDVNQGAGAARQLTAQVVYGSATFAAVVFSSRSYLPGATSLYAPAHGIPLALPVLFSTGSAPAISGLTNQTTYYVIPVDANNIGLAASSALAQAGTFVTFASSGPSNSSYSLTPLPITGTPTFLWQVSNDGSNWSTAPSTGTTTISSYSTPPASAIADFSWFNWRYLRFKVTAPTAGGLFIQANLNAKQ